MANFDSSRVSYSSLSKVVEKDNNNAQFHYIDDYTDSPWDLNSKSSPPNHTFYDDDFSVDGEGYDSSNDTCNSVQPYNNNNNSMHHPEVNLKNVLNGIFATVTGRCKLPSFISNQQALLPTSNVSFLGSAKSGDTFLNSSVYIPSAPPLLEPSGSSGVKPSGSSGVN